MNYFKAVSKVDVKMKVVPFFKIYNFAFMTKVQFQIDFELHNKIDINSKPFFLENCLKAKFGKL